jgi:hypothetical protein
MLSPELAERGGTIEYIVYMPETDQHEQIPDDLTHRATVLYNEDPH